MPSNNPTMNPENNKILTLAKKGGNDASLFLLREIQSLEKRIIELSEAMELPEDERSERLAMKLAGKFLAVEKGPQGEQGVEGPEGKQGEKGDEGEQGLQGEKGEKGERGFQGDRGEQGLRGERGEQGLRGERGEKGDAGSFSGRIDISAVKGLEDYEAVKKQANRSIPVNHGPVGFRGAVGFSFGGDGSTTTFTLPKEPALKGRALFIYRDGRAMIRTTDYTLAGRVVTTTFTAESSEIIDGFLFY